MMRKRTAVRWPDGTRRRIPRSTLHRWVRAFRKHGYPGLLPRQRADAGKPRHDGATHIDYAIGLLLEQSKRTLTQIETYLRVQFADYALSRATLDRHLRAHPAFGAVERLRGAAKKLYGRYEAERPHQCWQMDGKGPFRVRFTSGEVVSVHVLSVLDDFSRAVLAAIVAASEDTAATIAVFQKAAQRYGLPDRMQFDRGSAFDSETFRSGLAPCGVHRNHVRAKQPTAQGKIEAYHRSLGRWFVSELAAQQVSDLEHLQQLLDATIALVYQRHRHRVLGCSPEQRLAQQVSPRRISESDLVRAFFVERVAKSHPKTGEVQLPNGRFVVPLGHAGKEVQCRYDPLHPRAVLVTRDGRELELEAFAIKPLPKIAEALPQKRGEGQLQKLVDLWRGTPRPNAEPAFGLPEVFASLQDLLGRRVPASEADAKAVLALWKKRGPLPRTAWLLACGRTQKALGKGRALSVYLADLERQIEAHGKGGRS